MGLAGKTHAVTGSTDKGTALAPEEEAAQRMLEGTEGPVVTPLAAEMSARIFEMSER